MFMLVINVKHCGNPSTSVAVQTTSTKKHTAKLFHTAFMEFINMSYSWLLSVVRTSKEVAVAHAYI